VEDGAFYDVYGGKETTEVLMTVRGLWRRFCLILPYFVSLDSCFCLPFDE
jgi:hypothetical protein